MINLLFAYHLIFIILFCQSNSNPENYPGLATGESRITELHKPKKNWKINHRKMKGSIMYDRKSMIGSKNRFLKTNQSIIIENRFLIRTTNFMFMNCVHCFICPSVYCLWVIEKLANYALHVCTYLYCFNKNIQQLVVPVVHRVHQHVLLKFLSKTCNIYENFL